MKALCTFKNDSSPIGLRKDQNYEIIFAENLENHRVVVNTIRGRLEYAGWADFYQHWHVETTLDGTAMPD
jgi:hypothetical protein